jgi:hypothetical protein
MRPYRAKWLWLLLPGCVAFQLGSCVGDPYYFLVSTAAQLITANVVSTVYNLFVSV